MDKQKVENLKNFKIDLNRCLGEGQYGKVYYATHYYDPTKRYAVKIVSKNTLKKDKYLKEKFLSEIRILKKLKHPNIVKLHFLFDDNHYYYEFFEYCNGSDLRTLLKLRGRVQEEEARMLLVQIIKGFKELVDKNVIHRDIKVDNILMNIPTEEYECLSGEDKKKFLKNVDLTNYKYEIKIADLGFAKQMMDENDFTESYVGSPIYMAP